MLGSFWEICMITANHGKSLVHRRRSRALAGLAPCSTRPSSIRHSLDCSSSKSVSFSWAPLRLLSNPCCSFHVSLPTARLSSQGLICLNTYTSSSKGPNGGKDGSAMGEAEGLARRSWARLGSRQENQAFVFLSVSSTAVIGAQQSLTVL